MTDAPDPTPAPTLPALEVVRLLYVVRDAVSGRTWLGVGNDTAKTMHGGVMPDLRPGDAVQLRMNPDGYELRVSRTGMFDFAAPAYPLPSTLASALGIAPDGA